MRLQKNPQILRAWKRIFPRAYSDQKRVVDPTKATSTPVSRILISGKKFILVQACWPHNCGGNFIVFLIADDASEAYGLLSTEALKIQEEYFGAPNIEKSEMMKQQLTKE